MIITYIVTKSGVVKQS